MVLLKIIMIFCRQMSDRSKMGRYDGTKNSQNLTVRGIKTRAKVLKGNH